jgi:acyl dehydratase
MALPLARLGTVHGGNRVTISRSQVVAFSAATNEDHPDHRAGALAPPVFGAVATREALFRAVADVLPREALSSLVHGEQDMRFHRPLVPGQELVTTASPHSVRVSRSGTRLTVRLESVDAADSGLVLDQYVTLLVRGMVQGPDAGPDKPPHAFPEAAWFAPVAEGGFHVDLDQTFRYADASGDHMPIHVDEGYAKSVGLPGIVVHGLCSMALAGRVVVAAVAEGEPRRLCRLAVRFCGPILPGDDVRLRIYASPDGPPEAGARRYHFEGKSQRGQAVLCHGLSEVAR